MVDGAASSEAQIAFTAVVRPQKAEALVHALLECSCITCCHAAETRGSGRQGPDAGSAVLGLLPKVVVAGTARESCREELEQLVTSVCATGHSGDGKLFIMPLPRCILLDPMAEERC